MDLINGIATLVALLTFIGIIWWAFSRSRAKANRDASLLPFAQPDEVEEAAKKAEEETRGAEQKKQGESHE